MEIPRNATPGPSNYVQQPAGSDHHVTPSVSQVHAPGSDPHITDLHRNVAQGELAQSDNHSVLVNFNSNTVSSSSLASLPLNFNRHRTPSSPYVPPRLIHALPRSPPQITAYMRHDPLVPPSPPHPPIRRDTPPHLPPRDPPLPPYTAPPGPHLCHLHLPTMHPPPEHPVPAPPVPQQPPHHYAAPIAHAPHFPPFVPPLPQYAPPPPTYVPYGHHQPFPVYPFPPYLPYLPFHPSPPSSSRSLPTTSHIPLLNGSSDFAGWHEGIRTMIRHLGGFGHIASLSDPLLPHRPDLNPSAALVVTAVSIPFELDAHSKWWELDNVVQHVLVARLGSSPRILLPEEGPDRTARDIYDVLQANFGSNRRLEGTNLFLELMGVRCQPHRVRDYVTTWQNAVTRLRSCRFLIPGYVLALLFVKHLPDSLAFGSLRSGLGQRLEHVTETDMEIFKEVLNNALELEAQFRSITSSSQSRLLSAQPLPRNQNQSDRPQHQGLNAHLPPAPASSSVSDASASVRTSGASLPSYLIVALGVAKGFDNQIPIMLGHSLQMLQMRHQRSMSRYRIMPSPMVTMLMHQTPKIALTLCLLALPRFRPTFSQRIWLLMVTRSMSEES